MTGEKGAPGIYWVETRDAARSTVHSTASITKKDRVPNVTSADVENFQLKRQE